MVITPKIQIKINSNKLLNYYNSKGYNTKLHDTIEVNIEDIHNTPNILISLKCDICEHEFRTTASTYINRFKQKDRHACKNCRHNYVEQKAKEVKQKKRKLTKEEFSKLFRQV